MDPEQSPRERRRQQTRTAILEAARSLFYARGFEATTVGDIAQAADVALQTVFNHVSTKEELFFADRTPFAPAYHPDLFGDASDRGALLGALTRAAADYVGSLDDPVLRDMAAQIEAVPALSRYERTLYTHTESILADYLQATGRVAHPRWTAALLLATTRVCTHDHRREVIAGRTAPDVVATVHVELTRRLGLVLDATTTLPPEGAASPDTC